MYRLQVLEDAPVDLSGLRDRFNLSSLSQCRSDSEMRRSASECMLQAERFRLVRCQGRYEECQKALALRS